MATATAASMWVLLLVPLTPLSPPSPWNLFLVTLSLSLLVVLLWSSLGSAGVSVSVSVSYSINHNAPSIFICQLWVASVTSSHSGIVASNSRSHSLSSSCSNRFSSLLFSSTATATAVEAFSHSRWLYLCGQFINVRRGACNLQLATAAAATPFPLLR